MNNPMQTGPRIAYVLGGNKFAPRAHTVKLFTADGPREMDVSPVGPLKRTIETIVEMAPARIEAYSKDGKLLRSLDMTKLEDPEAAAGDASTETTVHVTREERLLSHFANLLSEGRKSADEMVARAFKQLCSIAEHHANRANALEHRNAVLQNSLVKQASNLVASQLAVAQAQAELRRAGQGGDGDEADSALLDLLRRAAGGGGDDDKPATANGAATPEAKQ